MKTEFIKIQEKRYRLSNIKRYEPFKSDSKKSHGIYVYFSTIGNSSRCYHKFEKEDDRDEVLEMLDQVFNTKI